jgi:hypothetical protein
MARLHPGQAMTRYASHIAIAATALAAGGLGATAFSNPETARDSAAVPTQPVPPEQVRTVVVTKTIHRVRHVRVHHRQAQAPAAPPPAPVAVAPAPAPAPVVTRRPVALRPTHPIQTRTSGHSGSGGEHESGDREGGGDD